MKDINVCKKCKHYEEDVVKLFSESRCRSFYEFGLKPKNAIGVLRKSHWCKLGYDRIIDHPGMEIDRIKLYNNEPKEYYKMTNTKDCPFYAEHMLHEMYNKEQDVNYGFSRHFRKTRICQHCGMEIPNRKHCDNCGYDWFDVYSVELHKCLKEIDENLIPLLASIAIIVVIGTMIYNIITTTGV